MESYETKDKKRKFIKIAIIALAVLLVLVFSGLFFTAHKNAASEGRAYSVKEFIIDFGAALRGKKLSSTKVFDGGLFPIIGLSGDNLPTDGTGINNGNGQINGDTSGNTAGNTSGSVAGDTSGVTSGNTAGDTGTVTSGTTSDNSTGTTTGETTGTTAGSTTTGTTSGSSAPQCSDGIDNDNDGLIDFPKDGDCTDAGDYFESPYDWNNNGGWVYNYDGSGVGNVDTTGWGYDFNFDPTNYTDPTQTPACQQQDYIFTPEEQAELDKLVREFYRIAPNLRTQADIDNEHGAKESYANLIALASEYTNSCIVKRQSLGVMANLPATHSRGVFPGLTNMDYSTIPTNFWDFFTGHTIINYISGTGIPNVDLTIGKYYTSPTFFNLGAGPNTSPGVQHIFSLQNMTDVELSNMVRMATGMNVGDIDLAKILKTHLINGFYDPHQTIQNSVLNAWGDTFINTGGTGGSPEYNKMRHAACVLRGDNLCGGDTLGLGLSFWPTYGAQYSDIGYSWSSNENDPYSRYPWDDIRLGACFLELSAKYPTWGGDGAGSQNNTIASGSIDEATFMGLVSNCYDSYLLIDDYRHAFENIFQIF